VAPTDLGEALVARRLGDRRKAMLQDIAVLTGGEVVSEDLGIKLGAGPRSDTALRRNASPAGIRLVPIIGRGTNCKLS
jgi:hypothetical protein